MRVSYKGPSLFRTTSENIIEERPKLLPVVFSDITVGADMEKRSNGGFLLAAGVVLSLGFSLVAAALLGMYIGSLMDKGSSTRIYTPIGLIIGLIVGFHRSWIIIRSLITKKKK